MTRPKVYVETTILSYLAARPSRDLVTAGRQVTTWQWRENERHKYSLTASSEVQAECEQGDPDVVDRRSSLLTKISLFPVDDRITELAEQLVRPGAIPRNAAPDAIHIAAANVAQCAFLLTWNLRHIANVRIRRVVERILSAHGYAQTIICTPDQLA
jgi:hypothetical protein